MLKPTILDTRNKNLINNIMGKIHEQSNDNSIQVHELEEGVLAVITSWPDPKYIGYEVFWVNDHLLASGRSDRWSLFKLTKPLESCRVRILER